MGIRSRVYHMCIQTFWREIDIVMESLQAILQARTLQQLGDLETRVSRGLQEQSEIEQKLQELRELKSKIEEVTLRKTELQQKLKHLPTESLRNTILKDVVVEDIPAVSLPVEVQREIVLNAAKEEQKRQLEYVLVAHRCAGITASFITGRRRALRIRFETSYKGEYFEPFYLELQFVERKIKVTWHTIPQFVHLADLTDQYNSNQLHFMTVLYMLHTFLIAYVQRREQTVEFTHKYSEYLQEEIAYFYNYSFIQLCLDIPVEGAKTPLVVHLLYKQLQSDLPSRVRCSNPDGLPVDRARIKQAFMTLPIAEAFQHLFLDQNIEQG